MLLHLFAVVINTDRFDGTVFPYTNNNIFSMIQRYACWKQNFFSPNFSVGAPRRNKKGKKRFTKSCSEKRHTTVIQWYIVLLKLFFWPFCCATDGYSILKHVLPIKWLFIFFLTSKMQVSFKPKKNNNSGYVDKICSVKTFLVKKNWNLSHLFFVFLVTFTVRVVMMYQRTNIF